MARQANPDSPCVWRQREEADGTDGVPQTVDGGEVVGAATASQVNSISHQEVKVSCHSKCGCRATNNEHIILLTLGHIFHALEY